MSIDMKEIERLVSPMDEIERLLGHIVDELIELNFFIKKIHAGILDKQDKHFDIEKK